MSDKEASVSTPDRPRRGWREKIEPGVRRAHRVDCPSTADHRPGRRCKCDAYEIVVPGYAPGTSRTVTVRGSITEARRQQRELQAAGRPQVAPEPAADTPSCLTDFAAEFLRKRKPVRSRYTIRNYATDYRLRIAPRLGHLPLDQITRHVCEGFVADLAAEGKSFHMVDSTVTTLHVMLGQAVAWYPDLLAANPASRLPLPPHDDEDGSDARRILTPQQLQRLLSHGSKKRRVQTMLRVAAEAGIRRGEICGLSWTDVDWKTNRLRIRRGYDGPTKGRRSRTLTVSAGFMAALAAWYDESVYEGAAPDGFVWPGRDGGMMHEHTPTQTCTRAMIRAGLVGAEGKPLVTLHNLRHTCGSLMLLDGVSLLKVSRYLGHASINITGRIYAHLLDESVLDAGVATFDSILGDDPDTLGDTLGDPIDAPETA